MVTRHVGKRQPLAIGRPVEVNPARALVGIAPVGNLAGLARVEVVDHDALTVEDEGQLRTVGRDLWVHLLARDAELEAPLGDLRRVGEVRVLAAGDAHLVERPAAALAARVDEATAVAAEGHPTVYL